jgi:hypothetical protein
MMIASLSIRAPIIHGNDLWLLRQDFGAPITNFRWRREVLTVQSYEDRERAWVDKRRFERIPIVEYTDIEGHRHTVPVKLLNISLGGVKFQCQEKLEKSSVYTLIMNFHPIDFPVCITIAWEKPPAVPGPYEYGAEFYELPREERWLLREHLEQLKKKIEEATGTG